MARRKPGCILLGTSRTGRGLDPDQPALRQLDCYNMALPSVSLYEMRRYFQHAQTAQRVILALDFFLAMFLNNLYDYLWPAAGAKFL